MDTLPETKILPTSDPQIINSENHTNSEQIADFGKEVLRTLKTTHPDYVYPDEDIFDDILEEADRGKCLTMVRTHANQKTLAVGIGFSYGGNFALKWLFSAQGGEGIRIIKAAQKKFDKITLMAAPVGYPKGEQEKRLNGIVAFYKSLGFNKNKDAGNEKYGGNVPMTWQFNKLMGGRPIP